MLLRIVAIFAVFWSCISLAGDWKEVQRSGYLSGGSVYCAELDNMKEFMQYVQDEDAAGAGRIIEKGLCAVVQRRMKVDVVYENGFYSNFFSPSGKAFFTVSSLIK